MPKATVAAIIHPAGDRLKILLTRRNVNPFNGLWCLPGGHVEDFEPAETAVRREVKEETGLDFAPEKFVGWFEEIFPEHRFHAVALAFAGAGSGALQQQPDEVSEMAWFALDEALSMQLAFTHNLVLQHYACSLEK
ncbi:NUDIX hydrolase [Chlorobaculum thiosulfatiphilum]|nr:NUDIX hydrolase [Chlorobaculum thiosulfatiphilum]